VGFRARSQIKYRKRAEVAEIPKDSNTLNMRPTRTPTDNLVLAIIHTPPIKLIAAKTAKITKNT
jgi:hypothetical protein